MHAIALGALVLALASPLLSSPVLAQSPREVTVAREAFQAGVTAAQAERWGEAREHFRRSYEINQRLSALMNLATAEENSGEIVEAAEHYREYLERAEDGDADEGSVRHALAALEPRVPKLRLLISELLSTDQVRVDNVQMSRELLQGPIPVNPGTREVTVLRDGANIATLTIQASEGQTIERALTLPEPIAVSTPEAPPEPTIPPVTLPAEQTPAQNAPVADEPSSGSVLETWWFWTIVGVVVVGGTIGILAATAGENDPVLGNGFDQNNVTLP